MAGYSPFTEEGRTRFRNFQRRLGGYLIVGLIIGVLAGFGFFRFWTRANMLPLQRLYLMQYSLGTLKAVVSGKASSKYRLLTCQVTNSGGKMAAAGVTDEQVRPVRDQDGRPTRNEGGYIFAWIGSDRGALSWLKVKVNDRQMVTLFRDHHYDGQSFFDLLIPSIAAGLFVCLGATAGLIVIDRKLNKKYEEGKLLRGTRLIQPENLELEADPPGLGVPSLSMDKMGWFKRLTGGEEPIHWLRIPREDEAAHTTILGDTGTGKSQLIHLFLWQIAQRRPQEAVIVYDPAGEFVASHFRAERGDIVLNPLDKRFPFWNPSAEVKLKTDLEMIAESFFPGSDHHANGFFLKATRGIFARLLECHLLECNPNPDELVRWLINEAEIDKRVQDTELVQLINKEAPQQRGGVLGTLSEAGNKLKLLPQADECGTEILLTRWAEKRRGWIFVTSTQDTRSQLRPLHAVFLDLLMKRLMTCDPVWGRAHPCWMIVDEAHALGKMPALYMALTEGRKFGLKLVIGTQNPEQFKEHYGNSSSTMLAASVLKIMFRCNEPDSARWVSELIGENEREIPKVGTTASVSDQGHDSLNYRSEHERRPVVSREQIMALKKLHGYWKYQDMVVPFRFEARQWPDRTDRFIPRQSMLAGVGAIAETPVEETETAPAEETGTKRKYRFVPKAKDDGTGTAAAQPKIVRKKKKAKTDGGNSTAPVIEQSPDNGAGEVGQGQVKTNNWEV